MTPPARSFVLRNARMPPGGPTAGATVDVALLDGVIVAIGPDTAAPSGAVEIDVDGGVLLPALVNAHDHLDAATFPPLGRPPYASLYEWTDDVARGGESAMRAALAVPLVDRLFLGGLRNLISGAASVAHHGVFHRSMTRPDFPVRVLERYQFAHSPGLTPALRKTYRSTDRRIPWFLHLAEGVDDRSRGELDVLVEVNAMRHNVVIVHGIGLSVAEAERLAEAEMAVVWSPESNRRLYGATAPVRELRAAGVRVALGSDSPAAGVRDLLSTLAAAGREGLFTEEELLDLVTRAAAEVARLPATELGAGSGADLLVVESLPRFLAGERAAIAGVWRDGRLAYGRAEWLPGGTPLRVDRAARVLAPAVGSRVRTLFARHPQVRAAQWAADVEPA
jgi:cytosine/adenosine deaminase-related metal-dependent hydrolase